MCVCVFPQCRKSFEPDVQFVVMCRIVTDQTQPMNHKVKLAWLEYLRELLPLVDSAEFKDTTGTPVVYFKDQMMPLQRPLTSLSFSFLPSLLPPSLFPSSPLPLPFFLLSLFPSLLLLLRVPSGHLPPPCLHHGTKECRDSSVQSEGTHCFV